MKQQLKHLTAFGVSIQEPRSGAGLYLFVLVRSMWLLSAGARLSSGANEPPSCAAETDIWSPASALRCRDRSHLGLCSVLHSNVFDITDTIYTETFAAH